MARDPLKALVLVVLFISFVTFVALFGRLPALRSVTFPVKITLTWLKRIRGTPISFLHRCIWIHGPNAFRFLDRKLTNGRVSEGGSRLSNYLMNEKHPLVIVTTTFLTLDSFVILILRFTQGFLLRSVFYLFGAPSAKSLAGLGHKAQTPNPDSRSATLPFHLPQRKG